MPYDFLSSNLPYRIGIPVDFMFWEMSLHDLRNLFSYSDDDDE